MQKTSGRALVLGWCALAGTAMTGTSLAQPSIYFTGFGPTDMTPNGQVFVGAVYDAQDQKSKVIRTMRGQAPLFTGGLFLDGTVHVNNDGSVISYADGNYENLNNAANSITYNPSIPQMWTRTALSHRWTMAGGRVNLGPSPTGFNCDFNINTPYGLSGDGRFLAVSGWTNSLCGPYRGMVLDTLTSSWKILPRTYIPPPAASFSRAVRANAVNGDGSVVCGWDENYTVVNPSLRRRPAVWVRDAATGEFPATTVLDVNGGEAYAISDDGNTVAGKDSAGQAVRWVRSGTTWTKFLLGSTGTPLDVNSDGSFILGEQFIWSPTINGGVAQDLTAYAQSRGINFGTLSLFNPFGPAVVAISDDGETIAVRMVDDANACLSNFTAGVLQFSTVPCSAPVVVMPPRSDLDVDPSIWPAGNFYGVIFNALVSGTAPLAFQWQKQNASGEWADLVQDGDCVHYGGPDFNIYNPRGSQLRIGFQNGTWPGTYRCIVSNACGTVTTDSVDACGPGTCPANCDSIDFNHDGVFPDSGDIADFLSVFGGGACSNDPNCGDLDFNNDGVTPDSADIERLLEVFGGGNC